MCSTKINDVELLQLSLSALFLCLPSLLLCPIEILWFPRRFCHQGAVHSSDLAVSIAANPTQGSRHSGGRWVENKSSLFCKTKLLHQQTPELPPALSSSPEAWLCPTGHGCPRVLSKVCFPSHSSRILDTPFFLTRPPLGGSLSFLKFALPWTCLALHLSSSSLLVFYKLVWLMSHPQSFLLYTLLKLPFLQWISSQVFILHIRGGKKIVD